MPAQTNWKRPDGWPRSTTFQRINGGYRWWILGPYNERIGGGWERGKGKANIAAKKFRDELKQKLMRQS